MTLDRDIRLSADQICYTRDALRRRKNELGRSIARADEQRHAGVKIQLGTYDRHVTELSEIVSLLDILDVAQRQIQHQIRQALDLEAK